MEITRREYKLPQTLQNLMKQHPQTGQPTTQKTLAAYLGIRQQSLSLHIKGETMPTPDKLLAMSDFFGVSADYMLTGFEDSERYSAMVEGRERRIDEKLGQIAVLCSQAENLALDLMRSEED